MGTFRVALAAGAAVVLVLGLARLFSLALIAAALLVPMLTVLYLVDVDVYEEEPARVLAFTLAWGAAAGVVAAIVAQAVEPGGAQALGGSAHAHLWLEAIVLPLGWAALMLGGPVVLLRYRGFNDVLDGVTFGAAAAVAFMGAQVLAYSASILGDGLRPAGLVLPWVVRLASVALALPVLAMAAVAAAAAALWLRYRAPVRDRESLGPLGHPGVALPAAAAFLMVAMLGQNELAGGWWLASLVALDLVALVWLRKAIHLGLLEESAEKPIGQSFECPNCHHPTARHTFCANCGVSLQALPKGRPG